MALSGEQSGTDKPQSSKITKMKPKAYIAHHIPGRVRVRIPHAKGNPELLQKIAQLALAVPGVETAECNPLTGSLLIRYAPDAHRDFEERLATHGNGDAWFSLQPSPGNGRSDPAKGSRRKHSAAASGVFGYFRELDEAVKAATDNQLDLKVILPLGVALVAMFALRGRASTPLWLTLMIFAFSSFLGLHAGEVGLVGLEGE